MEQNSTIPFPEFVNQYPSNSQIPFDLFVSKKYNNALPLGGSKGYLTFTDSTGNLVYKVEKLSKSTHTKLISDSSANTLFSINRASKGSWHGFKSNDQQDKDLVFVVDRTMNEFTRTEFKILLVDKNNEESKTELKMKGCPFKRACTIYKDDTIVAETSLMYKLGVGKVFVPRNRFRVTIFPGFSDHSLVAALVVIYFDGRKLWI